MFKVGQKVWCAIYGAGVIVKIQHPCEGMHPVAVEFHNGHSGIYTNDGKYCSVGNVTLFPYPIEITKAVVKPSIDWSQINDEYKWLSVDENDCAYVYEKEPKIDTPAYWCSIGASNFGVNGLVSYSRGTCDWKDSLVERPE